MRHQHRKRNLALQSGKMIPETNMDAASKSELLTCIRPMQIKFIGCFEYDWIPISGRDQQIDPIAGNKVLTHQFRIGCNDARLRYTWTVPAKQFVQGIAKKIDVLKSLEK